ncbi:MAG: SGNH/GDSL hydrolase family protein, partial [Clostridia bacterium]|nr:SGNH/GDSL hydrolase family protein [Clostridia bacterium]
SMSGLMQGEHTVTCIRITEILDATPLILRSIALEGDNASLLPPPPAPPRKMEFIGDSITCGFGILTPVPEGMFKPEEQDGAHTYAALTAAHFGADAHYICISGRGICRNCDSAPLPLIPEFFEQTTVSHPTPWDFSQFQPDIVVINAGTNDADGEGIPPADLAPGANAFLKRLRTLYPNACLLWVYGMMNNQMDEILRQTVEAQHDDKIRYLKMTSCWDMPQESGAAVHPNLRSHYRSAGVLIDVVAEMTGWEK